MKIFDQLKQANFVEVRRYITQLHLCFSLEAYKLRAFAHNNNGMVVLVLTKSFVDGGKSVQQPIGFYLFNTQLTNSKKLHQGQGLDYVMYVGAESQHVCWFRDSPTFTQWPSPITDEYSVLGTDRPKIGFIEQQRVWYKSVQKNDVKDLYHLQSVRNLTQAIAQFQNKIQHLLYVEQRQHAETERDARIAYADSVARSHCLTSAFIQSVEV